MLLFYPYDVVRSPMQDFDCVWQDRSFVVDLAADAEEGEEILQLVGWEYIGWEYIGWE
jgi:hypothetical protein